MILQFFIPPPDVATPLAQLGLALRNIIDPNFERRQQFENLLLTNPELGQQLAMAQREQEEIRQAQIGAVPTEAVEVAATAAPTTEEGRARLREGARAAAQVGPPPNILASAGFNPEQARELLSAFPETAEERMQKMLERASIPELAVQAQRANLEATIDSLNFQGEERELARQINTEFSNFVGILPPEDRFLLITSMKAPKFIDLLMSREQLSVQQRIARIKAAGDRREQIIDEFKLIKDLDDQEANLVDRIKETKDKTEKRRLSKQLEQNEQFRVQTYRELGIPLTTTFLTEEKRGFFGLGRMKIQFRVFDAVGLDEKEAALADQLISSFGTRIGKGTLSREQAEREISSDPRVKAAFDKMTNEEATEFWEQVELTSQQIRGGDGADVGEGLLEGAGTFITPEQAQSIVAVIRAKSPVAASTIDAASLFGRQLTSELKREIEMIVNLPQNTLKAVNTVSALIQALAASSSQGATNAQRQ